jgi:hypothetical protein
MPAALQALLACTALCVTATSRITTMHYGHHCLSLPRMIALRETSTNAAHPHHRFVSPARVCDCCVSLLWINAGPVTAVQHRRSSTRSPHMIQLLVPLSLDSGQSGRNSGAQLAGVTGFQHFQMTGRRSSAQTANAWALPVQTCERVL